MKIILLKATPETDDAIEYEPVDLPSVPRRGEHVTLDGEDFWVVADVTWCPAGRPGSGDAEPCVVVAAKPEGQDGAARLTLHGVEIRR